MAAEVGHGATAPGLSQSRSGVCAREGLPIGVTSRRNMSGLRKPIGTNHPGTHAFIFVAERICGVTTTPVVENCATARSRSIPDAWRLMFCSVSSPMHYGTSMHRQIFAVLRLRRPLG